MANCTQCGITIPDNQKVCSMCYGDIDYGSDEHYRDWAEQQQQQEQE